MGIEAKRGERETIGAFVRRFSRKVQQSGVLLRSREIRFYTRAKNKNKKRKAALRRTEIVRDIEKQKKLGKLIR